MFSMIKEASCSAKINGQNLIHEGKSCAEVCVPKVTHEVPEGAVVEGDDIRDETGKVKKSLQYVRAWRSVNMKDAAVGKLLREILGSKLFFDVPVVLHVFSPGGLQSEVAKDVLKSLVEQESVVFLPREEGGGE